MQGDMLWALQSAGKKGSGNEMEWLQYNFLKINGCFVSRNFSIVSNQWHVEPIGSKLKNLSNYRNACTLCFWRMSV